MWALVGVDLNEMYVLLLSLLPFTGAKEENVQPLIISVDYTFFKSIYTSQ